MNLCVIVDVLSRYNLHHWQSSDGQSVYQATFTPQFSEAGRYCVLLNLDVGEETNKKTHIQVLGFEVTQEDLLTPTQTEAPRPLSLHECELSDL